NVECSICLVPFEERTFVSQLQCAHAFHYECIHHWFSVGNCCPVCRTRIAYD
ncbi:hypothetical protein HELRODRAFT_147679, partial [Helobdella robusta]|uniref:RING-type E3 ubiquitin transferase n=1 Tax=Helobdella robusta TaxID=6412 RepID=T1EK21_HELRO